MINLARADHAPQFIHPNRFIGFTFDQDIVNKRIISGVMACHRGDIIQIHIPYLENTGQHRLYRWYDEGLDAFRSNNSAAQAVADQLRDELAAVLQDDNHADIDGFIAKTQVLSAEIEAQLHNGRDQLLELNML